MYAVIETGGKQYKVFENMQLAVEKLPVAEDHTVSLEKVLLIVDNENISIGKPYLPGMVVEAKVLKQGRDEKVLIQKFKSKTGYHKMRGHRQPYSLIKIERIGSGEHKAHAPKAAAEHKPKAKKPAKTAKE